MARARRRRRALARGKARLGGRSRGSRSAARVAWYGSGGQSPALQSHRLRQRAPRGFRVLYLIPIICSRQAEETRSEERRAGTERITTDISRWRPIPKKNHNTRQKNT